MQTFLKTAAFAAATLGLAAAASANHIWINEFHYDNPGTDVGEFVEVGLRSPNASGFTASDYALQFYNGSNGTQYGATTGTLNTFGTISAPLPVAGSTSTITLYSLTLPVNGLQNGDPDGIALVNLTNSTVEEFISYGGSFTAVGGLADGSSRPPFPPPPTSRGWATRPPSPQRGSASAPTSSPPAASP